MRKIYQKYFALPEEEKGIISERVFFARLAVSITCIVLCMSAMGFTAYAFFTASVSSNMNQIQAANFDLKVQNIESQTETSSASYESEKTYKLQAGSIYKFELVQNGNAKTGYCQILIMKDENTEGDSVFTRQFGKSSVQEEPVNGRVVQIEVEEETIVKFVPCWGTFNVEEKDRFDEDADMIVVGSDKTVSYNKISTSQIIGVTKDTVADTPGATSESTAISTPESASTPSEMHEAPPPTEEVTSEESTNTSEGTEMETEEKDIEYNQEND